MEVSGGDSVAVNKPTSQTYSQLGLDADDPLFGRHSLALLKCETLAALHATSPRRHAAASPREAASRILFPQSALAPSPHATSGTDKSSPFRVAVARTGRADADPITDTGVAHCSASALDLKNVLPNQKSFATECDSVSPGSSAWRVRTAFADQTTADSNAIDNATQTAIRVVLPTRTLTKYAWLDSSFAVALMWVLPATTGVLYYIASRPNLLLDMAPAGSTLIVIISFFACGLLSLALIFSRIETSFLLKTLLYTFEAAYLVAWMIAYLVASILQIPNEIDLRTTQLDLDAGQYIFFCTATLFCVVLCFVIVLFSDALIHISGWFKIYVRCHLLVLLLFAPT
jgi:hypothetical protein